MTALVRRWCVVYRPPAMKRKWLGFVCLALLSAACGSGSSGTAGNESSLVGGPCMTATECDQRLCEEGARFPGNMCTISCGASGSCPSGSACGELESGWVCLVRCMGDEDCRTDWTCQSVTEAGTNGASSVMVCLGPEIVPP